MHPVHPHFCVRCLCVRPVTFFLATLYRQQHCSWHAENVVNGESNLKPYSEIARENEKIAPVVVSPRTVSRIGVPEKDVKNNNTPCDRRYR